MSQAMGWTEIKVAVPLGWQELVAEAMGHTLCTTVQIGDHSVAHDPPPAGCVHLRSYVPTTQDNPALRTQIAEQLQELAQRSGIEELQGLCPAYKPLPPEDYATSWKKSWKPFRLRRKGREIVLNAPWNELPGGERLVMELEPGGAFGSGRHATTRTCLGVALERIRGGERVLDAGSGSGILAVAAVQLGADSAYGFDIDPVATDSARDLAARNQVEDRVQFETGTLERMPEGRFDVLFANIYSDVIIAFSTALRSSLTEDGWFAFSGCPMHRLVDTRKAILDEGFRIEEERRRGRWVTFVGRYA
ncbi:MAG: 50S ribosomal protein L11 methyltransferase [Planctomycetota bacterium]